jgi:hypothetical protein
MLDWSHNIKSVLIYLDNYQLIQLSKYDAKLR